MFDFSHGPTVSAGSYSPSLWDGSHDVASSIQSAISAVASAGGGVVEIPAGVWGIGSAIELASNVKLCGVGAGAVLEPTVSNSGSGLLLGSNCNAMLLSSNCANDVLVENLTFDGGGIDCANPNPVIHINWGRDVVFDHVTVENSRGIGLVFTNDDSSGVHDSSFINLGNHWETTLARSDRVQGLCFWGTNNAKNFSINNKFSDIGLDALALQGQNGFVASANTFELDNGETAVLTSPDFPAAIFAMYSNGLTISGNTINGAQGNGIDAPGDTNVLIRDNEITGCGGSGIGIFLGYDGTTQSSNIKIANNTLIDNVTFPKCPFAGEIEIRNGAPEDIYISGNIIINTHYSKTTEFAICCLDTDITNLFISKHNDIYSAGLVAFGEEDTSIITDVALKHMIETLEKSLHI